MLTIKNYDKLIGENILDWKVTKMKEDADTNKPFYYITLESNLVSKSNGLPDIIKLELSRVKNANGLYPLQSLNGPYIKEVSAENIQKILHMKYRVAQYIKESNIG